MSAYPFVKQKPTITKGETFTVFPTELRCKILETLNNWQDMPNVEETLAELLQKLYDIHDKTEGIVRHQAQQIRLNRVWMQNQKRLTDRLTAVPRRKKT